MNTLTTFAQQLQPSLFARHRLGFLPDPRQAEILDTTNPRVLLNCTRQWGKSTTTAARAVHHAVFTPNALVLICSRSGRQSTEVLRKCATFLARLGIRRRRDPDHPLSLVLPNAARILALPNVEANIRGFSAPTFVLIDEAARVPDALYFAVLPMLATVPDSPLWILSTPDGKHGFFYDEWHNPDSGFTRLTVTAPECPRIPKTFLARQQARLPRHVYEQEYLCTFHSSATALFDEDEIDAIFDPATEPLFP